MKKAIGVIGKVISIVMMFVATIIISAIIAQLILGVGLAHVKGDSMNPNLKEGQMYMFTERSSIERYDIVLSDYTDDMGDKVLIKRVIGIPGDDLAVINGKLYINKMYYEEPYVVHDSPEFENQSFREKLGEDEYFLMGDNRDHSMDSREDLGIVKRDKIRGVVKRDLTKLKKGVGENE